MREAGDVCYADVYKDGTGVVEFLRYEDMKYAARKLDDTKFRSHEVCLKNLCKRSLNVLFWQDHKRFKISNFQQFNALFEYNINCMLQVIQIFYSGSSRSYN